jgi:hypothetical protein
MEMDGIMKTCQLCVNDHTVSGITFDKAGICSYCNEYKKYETILTDYENLSTLWNERISAYKGKGPFDAVMGISGGKDSTYVLYQLVKVLKLKVLAVTVDNGFLNDWSRNRINSIVKEIGVDHKYITYPKKLMQNIYQSSISAVGSPCIGCSYLIYFGSIFHASKLGIPMVIHGRSPAQMLKYFSSENSPDMVIPFLFSSLKHLHELDLDKTYKDVFECFEKKFPDSFMKVLSPLYPDFKEKVPTQFIPYFLYHKYDENEIVAFLEKNMSWRKPSEFKLMSHYDCDSHDATSYLYEIAEGRPHILPELSVAVRLGKLSRADAMKRLDRERMIAVPEKSMEALSSFLEVESSLLMDIAERIANKRGAAKQL